MASLGSIFVDLVARTGQYKEGFKQAEQSTISLEKTLEHFHESLDGIKESLAEFAGAAFSLEFIKSSVEAGAQLAVLSKETDVSVESLSALSLVAKESEVPLDELARAIDFMNRNLANAAAGVPKSQQAFSQLGLSVKELLSLSPDERLLKIADAVNQLGNSADRTKAEMDIFGRSGAQLGRIFDGGADSIKKAMDQAQRLGLVTSKEEAERMEEFNKKWIEFVTYSERLAQLSFVGISNLIEKAAGNVAAFVDPDAAQTSDQIDIAIQRLQNRREALLDTYNKKIFDPEEIEAYKKKIQDVDATLDELNRRKEGLLAAQKLGEGAESQSTHGTKKLDILSPEDAQLQREAEAIVTKTSALSAYNAEVEKLDTLRAKGFLTEQQYNDALDKSQETLADATANEIEQAGNLSQIYKEIQTPLEKYVAAEKELYDLRAQGLITDDTLNKDLAYQKKLMDDAEASSKKLSDSGRELGYAFSSAFENAITKGANLRTVLQGLADDLLKIFLRQQVTSPLANAFGSILPSNIFGNLFGGKGGGVPYGPSLPNSTEAFGPAIPSFDVGSWFVPNDMLAEVHRGETILPADDAAAYRSGKSGGGGNVYHIDARGADNGAVARLQAVLFQLAGPGVVEQRIRDAQKRGMVS